MTIISREQAAESLSVDVASLLHYEELGFVHAVRSEQSEGYEPSEIRRIWTVLTLHRDAGINLPGIEAVLKLRDFIAELHGRMDQLAKKLDEAVEGERDGESEPDAT